MEQKQSSNKSERKKFSSRLTTFPIYAESIGDAWLQLLNLVLRVGFEKKFENSSRVAESLNVILTIEQVGNENDFYKFFGFSADAVQRRLKKIESAVSKLTNKNHQDKQRVGQIEILSNQLRESPENGVSIFFIDDESKRISTDFTSVTFSVIDRKLIGSSTQLKANIFTEWPIEALALAHFQRKVAEQAGLEIGALVYMIKSAQLYDEDWERAEEHLKEFFKRPLPLQIDPAGIFLFGNNGGKASAMLLDHDASKIFWEGGFDDPEDLSWYIVDVMPWLHPQHIRYVGQECAALMRAIRSKECYVQG